MANIFNEMIEKFNPYHDRLGRFTFLNRATSFTYRPGQSRAHDMAIMREKEFVFSEGTQIQVQCEDGKLIITKAQEPVTE